MNKVSLIGRLTKDPIVRYTQGQNQMAVAKFTLAVDRRFQKNGEQTADFIPCTAFKGAAEFAQKYFRQGTKIAVTGRIQTGSYTDPQTGEKVYTTDVIIEEQEFAESKKAQETTTAETQNSSVPRGYGDVEVKPRQESFMDIPDGIDEELPFN